MTQPPNLEYRQCSPVARFLGKWFLQAFGWKVAGDAPNSKDMVVIAAPHTSNWDFVFLVAAAYSFGISINWLGKNTLFTTPILGKLLLWLGGISVDRSQATNMVDMLARQIVESSAGTNLVVPPSGTRRYTEYWKSGFYHIARNAQIPLVCGYLDYSKKEAGLGPAFIPKDMPADMQRLREFYGPITAKFPEKKSRIRLREEDES